MAAAEKKNPAAEADSEPAAAALEFREENLSAIWQQVISSAGFALSNDLRKVASLAISGPNTLVLRVSERYNTPNLAGADPGRWTRAEGVLSQVVGKPCTIRVETIREEAVLEPGPAGGPAAVGSGRQLRERVKQIPQVRKAQEVLGAEIVNVDPDFGEAAPAAPPPENGAVENHDEE